MMKVQVNTDDNIQGDEGLTEWVETEALPNICSQ
jgi:hypothetical protein